jgi:hypothetical protein
MPASQYGATTGGAVALTAAAAKSILGVRGNAAFGVALKYVQVGFAGVTASDAPVLVELCYATFATNAPGTASTSVTPFQANGRVLAHGTTAAKTWTTEPTVLTVIDEMLLTPNGGLVKWAYPLGDEPDSAFSEGFVIRCNAPTSNVDVRATVGWNRC